MNPTVYRYVVLIIGIGLGIFIIAVNYESPELLLTQAALIFLWILVPFYLYFFTLRKSSSLSSVVIPSILMLAAYFFISYEYYTSDSSTAAIALLILPIYGFAALGLGCFISWIVSRRKKVSN
jgi:hypothetical protein